MVEVQKCGCKRVSGPQHEGIDTTGCELHKDGFKITPPASLEDARRERLRARAARPDQLDLLVWICKCGNYRNWLLHVNAGDIECGECGLTSANAMVTERPKQKDAG